MAVARLLLVPSFTELEWGIRPRLEEWAEVVSFDMPGIGGEPFPDEFELAPDRAAQTLLAWRRAGAERALAEVDRRGWERFALLTESYGAPTAVELAHRARGSVAGIAIGHAALSHASEGERAPLNASVWGAFRTLARQGNEAFVRHGLAQLTRGAFSEELAGQMVARFPDMELVSTMVEALGREPEPIGDALAALALPLLLAKHEGCLGHTDEGFEDIVAAFSDARTVICEEACASSPAFAEAIERFCAELGPG